MIAFVSFTCCSARLVWRQSAVRDDALPGFEKRAVASVAVLAVGSAGGELASQQGDELLNGSDSVERREDALEAFGTQVPRGEVWTDSAAHL
jgi:hypothetical protein